jgi:hypothetical protein
LSFLNRHDLNLLSEGGGLLDRCRERSDASHESRDEKASVGLQAGHRTPNGCGDEEFV